MTNLLAETLHQAGTDGQHNLVVQVAADTLRGIPQLSIFEVAQFADDMVCHQARRADALNQDVIRRMTSDKARSERLRALRAGERPPEGTSTVVHRAGTLLAAGIASGIKERPYRAKDGQLFAALGLLLLNIGLRHAYGEDRERYLLDAFECVLGWQHIKRPPKNHKLWIVDLNGIECQAFLRPDGRVMYAEQAREVFLEHYPEHAADVAEIGTFRNEFTPIRKLAREQVRMRLAASEER